MPHPLPSTHQSNINRDCRRKQSNHKTGQRCLDKEVRAQSRGLPCILPPPSDQPTYLFLLPDQSCLMIQSMEIRSLNVVYLNISNNTLSVCVRMCVCVFMCVFGGKRVVVIVKQSQAQILVSGHSYFKATFWNERVCRVPLIT